MRWIGSWLGGQATAEAVRAAIAWSSAPRIWTLLLLIPKLGIAGNELFTMVTPRLDANPMAAMFLLGFDLIEVVIGEWSAILFFKCLGEAHQFLAWKAFAASARPMLVILAPIMVMALLLLMGPAVGKVFGY